MSPRLPSRDHEEPGVPRVLARLLERGMPSAPSASKNASCTFTPTTYGARGVHESAGEARAGLGGGRPARVRAGAKLEREEVGARIDPEDDLAALALDRLRDAVAEGRRPRCAGLARPPAAYPNFRRPRRLVRLRRRPRRCRAASSGSTVSSGGGRRTKPATSRSSSASSGAYGRASRRAPARFGDERARLDRGAAVARQPARRGDPSARDDVRAEEARRRPRERPGRARRGAGARAHRGPRPPSPARRAGRAAGLRPRSAAPPRGVRAWIAPARAAAPSARPSSSSGEAPARARAASSARRRERIGPSGAGLGRNRHALALARQVEVPVGPRPAGVGGRPQLAEEPELLERRLELGAEHAPLDSLERRERGLHGRALAVGAEVRAQPGAQVAGPADVEHLVTRAAEEIDARPLRRAERERALVVRAPGARRGDPLEVGDRRARRAPGRGRRARRGSRPSPARPGARGGTGRPTSP